VQIGRKVKITTSVSPAYRNVPLPAATGTVTYKDFSSFPVRTLAIATIVNGSGSTSLAGLSFGEHVIVPLYSGDSHYYERAGPSVTVQVNMAGVFSGSTDVADSNYGFSEVSGVDGGEPLTEAIGEGGFGPERTEIASSPAPNPTWGLSSSIAGFAVENSAQGRVEDVGLRPLRVSPRPAPLQLPDEAQLKGPAMPLALATEFSGFIGLNGLDSRCAGVAQPCPSATDIYRNPDAEPPDQALAVSETQVLEAVNSTVAVYDKLSHKMLAGPVVLNSFFGLPAPDPLPGGSYGPFLSDPRGIYDPDTHRWFVTAVEVQTDPSNGSLLTQSTLLLAVSNSSDASRTFKVFAIDLTDTGFGACPCVGDHPNIGINPNGLFISTNEYSFSDHTFQTALIIALDKHRLAAGLGSPVVGFQDLGAYAEGAYSLMPAQLSKGGDTSDDGTEYFLSSADQISSSNPSGLQNTMTVWALTNTGSLRRTAKLRLQAVTIDTEAYSQPVAAQQEPGPTPLRDYLQSLCIGACHGTEPFEILDQDDDRVQQVSLSQGTLYSVLSTAVYPSGSVVPTSGVAWFSITPTMTNGMLSATVSSQGYVVTNGSLLYPVIAVNTSGNGAIGFGMMSESQFPSLGYVPITDGQVGSSIRVITTGAAPEDGFTGYALPNSTTGMVSYIPIGLGNARWGDYSGATVDPAGNIWFAGEYVSAPSYTCAPPYAGCTPAYTNWGTYIANLGIK